jgi:hypothetical protein
MLSSNRILIAIMLCFSTYAIADDKADMLTVAGEALERISEEDSAGLAGLMIEEAMIYVSDMHEGKYRVRTRTYADTRDRAFEVDLVERGWDPTILISGTIGIIWYPYDIYIDGAWSHCGIDIFNMIRTEEGWRIATLQYNVLQPPACEPHPDGPPATVSK